MDDLVLKLGQESAEREWEEARTQGIRILSIKDAAYPKKLKELTNPPSLLWAKGDLALLAHTLGIVGTRNATLYGREVSRNFSKQAAGMGVAVVSGLARGIDTEAHVGAMSAGKTVAIIGSGFASLYPAENRELGEKIGKEGLLLSEYPIHTPPNKYQFPARNRLIAALSEKLLVIEAPLKSGSLITVEAALRLNRPVFAIPGRIDSENFVGNHQLLKEGKAKLALSIFDVLDRKSTTILPVINEGLLSFFTQSEIDVETLSIKSNLPLSTVKAQLTRLVLQGRIRQLAGGFYKISS